MDIAIYAHGGLTDEDAAAETARAWVPHLYTHKVFPIFLMWETGAVETLRNMFADVIRGEAELTAAGGRWDRFKERFSEWQDARLEGVARLPGGRVWGEMKQNAAALSGAQRCGHRAAVRLFRRCARNCRAFACTSSAIRPARSCTAISAPARSNKA